MADIRIINNTTPPLARVSNDAGATFGPLMMLGANGALGSGEEAEDVALVEDEE